MRVNKDLVAASATPLVLGILSAEESYGYAILKRIAELSEGRLDWTDGMLYPLLHRLERNGLVESEWQTPETGRRRKYYRITSAGRDALADQREQWSVVSGALEDLWRRVQLAVSLTPSTTSAGVTEPAAPNLDQHIAAWRSYLAARSELARDDVEELEDHLRSHITDLTALGLDDDEAFLVGVKRMGAVHEISLEFAREYTSRLWKQLTLAPESATVDRNVRIGLGLAVGAALIVQIQHFIAPNVLARNLSLLVLPFLAAYFAWTRRVGTGIWITIAASFGIAALAANAYPFVAGSDTEILVAIHLPIALWLVVGLAHTAGEWRSHDDRMHFVRFTGEWFVYYVLIALGGGVLIGLMTAVFEAIGVAAEDFLIEWVLVSGAAGAVLIAAWLVDAKQTVIENIAPVLSQIFTPLFTLALLAFLVVTLFGGSLADVDRTALIVFNLLLVVVLGLLVYTISARDPQWPARTADVVQFVLLASALIADLMVLSAIVSRIAEFGFSANKTAALGENLVLLGNLIWATVLSWGFVRRRRHFEEVERWQTAYLPIYGAWAVMVVVAFPLLFGF